MNILIDNVAIPALRVFTSQTYFKNAKCNQNIYTKIIIMEMWVYKNNADY